MGRGYQPGIYLGFLHWSLWHVECLHLGTFMFVLTIAQTLAQRKWFVNSANSTHSKFNSTTIHFFSL